MASIDFDPEDYLHEVDTDALIDELKSREEYNKKAKAYMKSLNTVEEFSIPEDISPRKLKEAICDYLQLSHCSEAVSVLTELHLHIR